MVSSDDHCQEVVGLCREKSYAGLVGCSGEYLVFQPPRYFSSSQLKLTYRVSTTFYVNLFDLRKKLGLTFNCLLFEYLKDYFKKLGKIGSADYLCLPTLDIVRKQLRMTYVL